MEYRIHYTAQKLVRREQDGRELIWVAMEDLRDAFGPTYRILQTVTTSADKSRVIQTLSHELAIFDDKATTTEAVATLTKRMEGKDGQPIPFKA